MARETRRRDSSKRVSYNYKEAFKDLELSGSELEAEEQDAGEVDDGEPDDFVPPAEEEDDPDEFVEDVEEEEQEEEGEEEDADDPSVKVRPEKPVILEPGTAPSSAPATPAHSAKGSKRSRDVSGVSHAGTPGGAGMRSVGSSAKATGVATTRQRIVAEWREGGKESRLKNLFGPTPDDLRPIFETMNRWLSQETLPSRSFKHLAPSPFVTEKARQKDVTALRHWYTSLGQTAFAQGQQTVQKSEEEAQAYLVNPGPESLNLMMGSLKNQQVYSLKKGKYISAATPFGSGNRRKGWTLYMGSRIQDVQWAPNEQGNTQYLAVIVEQRDTTGKKYKHLGNLNAPAFTKTNAFSASIQIWAFDSKADGSMDSEKEPRLAHVICTDWGAPRAIKWWPIGTRDSAEHGKDGVVHLGLLASIWSDGKVRILDVSFQKPQADSSQTQYVHYTQAALELAFDDASSKDKDGQPVERRATLPTCLCWLSPTTLAVGTASGVVAIWTLTQPGLFSSPKAPDAGRYPQPWFHKQLADTYIITVSSGYPSRPHFLSLTTADGFGRLIDLRAPAADAMSSPRGRMLVHSQAWHEHTQSFVMVDEYYMLKHSSLRRYHQAIYTFRADSTLTTVATSPVHPAVLIGTSDGTVAATNGMCKMFSSKEIPWSQTWFKHEWRRPLKEADTDAAGDSDMRGEGEISSPTDPAVASRPLTRITEGYKPVKASMQPPDSTKGDGRFIKIFEENSAATRAAWNPNLKFGTWAVAGMQSGMLRVEDLGV